MKPPSIVRVFETELVLAGQVIRRCRLLQHVDYFNGSTCFDIDTPPATQIGGLFHLCSGPTSDVAESERNMRAFTVATVPPSGVRSSVVTGTLALNAS